MGIISAFKHEPTGKLFEKEADFKKYIKSYNKEQEKISLEEKAKELNETYGSKEFYLRVQA